MNFLVKAIFFLGIVFGLVVSGSAQNSVRQLDVSFGAPEAAELAKYGNLEVNMFKGVPEVTVPIHTLEVGGFSLPIFLAYDAGGIKVDQIATNVGLGWSLHAGGQITVAAYGKDDFLEPVQPFVQDPDDLEDFDPNEWISAGTTAGKDDYDTAWDMFDPTFGGQHLNLKPDVFYYNFAGNNGKFVIEGNIKSSFAHYTVPYRRLKLSYSLASGFEIIDKNGTTFIFDVLDVANVDTDLNNCFGGPGSSNGQATPVPRSKLNKDVRTWHLGKIITAGGDEIVFTYDNSQTNYEYVQSQIEQQYERVAPVAGCQATISDYNCTTTKTVSPQRLSSITHARSGQVVEFIYSGAPRQDFGNDTYTALDQIKVKQNGADIKVFDLDTDGYLGSGSTQRLKLAGVQQQGMPTGYTFDYNTSISLPARLNKGQDHWGFFNGKAGNPSLIPNYHVVGGGDRSVDPAKVGAWVLQKITYPAGGSTVLNMEGIPTGGGLRVASIHDLDGLGNTTHTRNYAYETTTTGGFYYVDLYEYYLESDYTGNNDASCKYNMYTSQNLPPVLSMDSPDYGFSKVTITHEGTGDAGRSEYYYATDINDLSAVQVADAGALNWGRGELIKSVQYDEAEAKLAEQVHTFTVHKTNSTLWGNPSEPHENYIYGVDIQLKRPELTKGVGGEYNLPYTYPARFDLEKFRIISAWYHPDSTMSYTYDPVSSAVQQTSRTSEYRTSTQLRRVIQTNSDAQIRTTEYEYASEQYSGMAALHMLTQPYKVTLKDGPPGSNDILRIDWTLWGPVSVNGQTVWKPCSRWVGGLGLETGTQPGC